MTVAWNVPSIPWNVPSIPWNVPSIPHSDGLIKEAIDCMHGAGHWHFYRESSARRPKFFKVSEAVDSLLNIKSKFFL